MMKRCAPCDKSSEQRQTEKNDDLNPSTSTKVAENLTDGGIEKFSGPEKASDHRSTLAFAHYAWRKKDELVKELSPQASINERARHIALSWRKVGEIERRYWEEEARKDKDRTNKARLSKRAYKKATILSKSNKRMYVIDGKEQAEPKNKKPCLQARGNNSEDSAKAKPPTTAFSHFPKELLANEVGRAKTSEIPANEAGKVGGKLWKATEGKEHYHDLERKSHEEYKMSVSEWRYRMLQEEKARSGVGLKLKGKSIKEKGSEKVEKSSNLASSQIGHSPVALQNVKTSNVMDPRKGGSFETESKKRVEDHVSRACQKVFVAASEKSGPPSAPNRDREIEECDIAVQNTLPSRTESRFAAMNAAHHGDLHTRLLLRQGVPAQLLSPRAMAMQQEINQIPMNSVRPAFQYQRPLRSVPTYLINQGSLQHQMSRPLGPPFYHPPSHG